MGDGEAGAPGHSVRRTGLRAGRAAGSVPRRPRGLARGRTRGKASGDRTRGGRGRHARRWARGCRASGRGPVGQVQLGRHETEVAQLQLVVNASLDRLPDVSGRKERRGTRGVVRDQLDQLTGELAKPAIRLDNEREKLSVLLLSPCEVLAVLGRLGAGSSAQGTLRGTGQVSGCRGVPGGPP